MKRGKNLNQLYPLGWNEDYRKPDDFNKRNCLSRFEKAGKIQPDIDSSHPTIQKRFDRFSNYMFKENIFCPLRTLFKIIYNWDYSIFGMYQLFSEPSYMIILVLYVPKVGKEIVRYVKTFFFFCKVLELDYQCLRYIINILCISADIYVDVVVLIYFHLYLGGKISIVFSLLFLDIFFLNLIQIMPLLVQF